MSYFRDPPPKKKRGAFSTRVQNKTPYASASNAPRVLWSQVDRWHSAKAAFSLKPHTGSRFLEAPRVHGSQTLPEGLPETSLRLVAVCFEGREAHWDPALITHSAALTCEIDSLEKSAKRPSHTHTHESQSRPLVRLRIESALQSQKTFVPRWTLSGCKFLGAVLHCLKYTLRPSAQLFSDPGEKRIGTLFWEDHFTGAATKKGEKGSHWTTESDVTRDPFRGCHRSTQSPPTKPHLRRTNIRP